MTQRAPRGASIVLIDLTLIGLAVFCQADVVFGASFTVNPTIIELSSRSSSVMVTVRNESTETMRFQLAAFTWNQRPDGEMELTPTEDIVFFPVLFSIEPKQERRVRVGLATGFGAIEKTYRLFVEEIPSEQSAPSAGAAVQVRTKMGLPIFLRPVAPKSSVTLSTVGMSNGRVEFTVQNTGNIRVIPRGGKLTGFDEKGNRLFASDLPSWYVLANGVRSYSIDLSGGQCAQVRRLEVEFAFASATLKERLDTPRGVCGS